MNIGGKIAEIRKAKGITQVYVIRQMGKSAGWLNNIEKGRRAINADKLKQIADILGVSVGEFFKADKFHVTCNNVDANAKTDHTTTLDTGTDG